MKNRDAMYSKLVDRVTKSCASCVIQNSDRQACKRDSLDCSVKVDMFLYNLVQEEKAGK